MLKKLLEYIVVRLVDHAHAITINEDISDTMISLTLTVAPQDLGKIIGREGKTARAMRTLLYAAAEAQGKKVSLEIIK